MAIQYQLADDDAKEGLQQNKDPSNTLKVLQLQLNVSASFF